MRSRATKQSLRDKDATMLMSKTISLHLQYKFNPSQSLRLPCFWNPMYFIIALGTSASHISVATKRTRGKILGLWMLIFKIAGHSMCALNHIMHNKLGGDHESASDHIRTSAAMSRADFPYSFTLDLSQRLPWRQIPTPRHPIPVQSHYLSYECSFSGLTNITGAVSSICIHHKCGRPLFCQCTYYTIHYDEHAIAHTALHTRQLHISVPCSKTYPDNKRINICIH